MRGKKGQIDTLTDLIRDAFDINGIKISMIKARLHAMDLYHRGCRVHAEGEWVEVVRCKGCMFWRGKDHDGVCIKNGLATRMANEFCSRGEKKGDESDARN